MADPREHPNHGGGTNCVSCRQWLLKEDDLFCGYCGKPNIPVAISPTEPIRLVDGGVTDMDFQVNNLAETKTEISIQPTGDHLPYLSVTPAEVRLDPGRSTNIRFSLDSRNLPRAFKQAEARFLLIINGQGRKTLPISVFLSAGPRVEISPPEIVFPEVREGERTSREVTLTSTGGAPLIIESLGIQGSSSVTTRAPFPFPLNLEPGRSVSFPVDFIASPTEAQGELTATSLVLNYPHGKSESIPVRATVSRVSMAAVPDRIKAACSSRRNIVQTIHLVNTGTKDIDIVNVEADRPWVEVHLNEKYIRLAKDTPEPGIPLELLIRTAGLPPGAHTANIRLDAHQGGVILSVPIALEVVKTKPYKEYIGVDFGTTNSVVAIFKDNQPQVVEVPTYMVDAENNPIESPLIPSVLVFRKAPDDYLIGYEARNIAELRPSETVRSVKRIMGYDNTFNIQGHDFNPEALASKVISHLTALAEDRLQKEFGVQYQVTKAIVTVPALFYDPQIRAILDAVGRSGLDTEEKLAADSRQTHLKMRGRTVNCSVVLPEPTAAALYYLYKLQDSPLLEEALANGKMAHLLIYDHGGGTLDVSVVQVAREDGDLTIRVLASQGNSHLGGDHLDHVIMKRMVEMCALQYKDFDRELILAYFNEIKKRAVRENWTETALQDVLRARLIWKDQAEKLKIGVSSADSGQGSARAVIDTAYMGRIVRGTFKPCAKPFEIILAKSDLESLIRGILVQCQDLVKKVLFQAQKPTAMNGGEIDFIIHTGRSSLLPQVQTAVRDLFPALGQGRVLLDEKEIKICVALGAALYGSVRFGLGKGIVILDEGHTLPHAYGVEQGSWNRTFDEIIPIGTVYPVEVERNYQHGTDFHEACLNLSICKNSGTRKEIKNNPDIRRIGRMTINTFEDGVPGCNVRFVLDVNGILEVYADGKKAELEHEKLEEPDRWIC